MEWNVWHSLVKVTVLPVVIARAQQEEFIFNFTMYNPPFISIEKLKTANN